MSRTSPALVAAAAALPGCAPPPARSAPAEPAATEAGAQPARTPAAAPAPSASPRARSAAVVPPLASPNPRAAAADAGAGDAGVAPPEPRDDPQAAALRLLGQRARDCHERHAPGRAGRVQLRLMLEADGRVKSAGVVAAASTAALIGGELERCVIQASRELAFPAPRGEDAELEIPLSFSLPAER